jgi:hypothetical protein
MRWPHPRARRVWINQQTDITCQYQSSSSRSCCTEMHYCSQMGWRPDLVYNLTDYNPGWAPGTHVVIDGLSNLPYQVANIGLINGTRHWTRHVWDSETQIFSTSEDSHHTGLYVVDFTFWSGSGRYEGECEAFDSIPDSSVFLCGGRAIVRNGNYSRHKTPTQITSLFRDRNPQTTFN